MSQLSSNLLLIQVGLILAIKEKFNTLSEFISHTGLLRVLESSKWLFSFKPLGPLFVHQLYPIEQLFSLQQPAAKSYVEDKFYLINRGHIFSKLVACQKSSEMGLPSLQRFGPIIFDISKLAFKYFPRQVKEFSFMLGWPPPDLATQTHANTRLVLVKTLSLSLSLYGIHSIPSSIISEQQWHFTNILFGQLVTTKYFVVPHSFVWLTLEKQMLTYLQASHLFKNILLDFILFNYLFIFYCSASLNYRIVIVN